MDIPGYNSVRHSFSFVSTFTFVLLFLWSAFIQRQGTHGLPSDTRLASYVSQLVDDFKRCPTNGRFDRVLIPPLLAKENLEDYVYPKVFIWCPIEHYGLEINCPIHKRPLKPTFFTDEIEKTSPRNPRLVYDLRGNVLLIQRMYVCHNEGMPHRYLSAGVHVLQSIPRFYGDHCFPFVMFHKSACTKELVDFIETQILQGVSFLQMSEGIAALNFKESCTRMECLSLSSRSCRPNNKEIHERFYSDVFFSFPSNDHLMTIFLDNFQRHKAQYESHMKELASTSKKISCDHTFKVSKYIGARRGGDNKFVKQFHNLFIILNEKREVVSWRLTRTTAFEEIRELLEDLSREQQINKVIVDDCCKVRAQYQVVLTEAEVKLDLFHAVQRVTKSVPKGTEFSKKFSKEFGNLFRANGDCGTVRKLPTPSPQVIERNLDNFLKRWERFLNLHEMRGTVSEIERLRGHIRKGCLSGLEPGEGTEANESLHHTLNKTLLCGATTIGPELVIAILTLLFYGINCKIGGKKHSGNSKITPFMPLLSREGDDLQNAGSTHFKLDSNQEHQLDNVWKFHDAGSVDNSTPDSVIESAIVVVDEIQDLRNETISELLLKNMLKLHHVLSNIDADFEDRCFSAFDLPIIQVNSIKQALITEDGQTDDVEQSHEDCLHRNLASVNRCIDPVSGDGDCAFRSIVTQLRKTKEWNEENSTLLEHLTRLGLGKTIDEDVFQLRQCFVDNVQSNEHYQMLSGVPLVDMNYETERFREQGSFCGDVGDLVIKVCADILKVSIFIVTSLNGKPYVGPFVPDETFIEQSLYITYTAFGPGHYDCTMSIARPRAG